MPGADPEDERVLDSLRKMPPERFNEVLIALLEAMGFELRDASFKDGALSVRAVLEGKEYLAHARQDE